jgi:hypothetical protein
MAVKLFTTINNIITMLNKENQKLIKGIKII